MDIARLGMIVDSSQLTRGTRSLREFQGEAKRTEAATTRMGRLSSAALGKIALAATAALGALASVGSTLRVLRAFEGAMSRVEAITGATASELEAMRAISMELGRTTEFTAAQAADGLRFLGMAGFEAREAVAALPAVLDLATASAMDLGRTADIASNIMSGFQIEAANAGKVADILARASTSANTTVEELGQAMAYAAPVAEAMGISVEETAAAVGTLSDAGIKGSRAGTSLRRVFTQLVRVTPQAEKALSEMGLTIAQVNPETNELTTIIQRLADAGITASQAMTIFGEEGGPAILALTSQSGELKDLTDTIEAAEGAAREMAETMRDNLGGDLKALGSALQGLAIAIGDAGLTALLRGATQAATELARALTELVTAGRAAADWLADSIARLVGLSSAEDTLERAVAAANAEIVTQGSLMAEMQGLAERARDMTLEQAEAHLAAARARRAEIAAMAEQARAQVMEDMGWNRLLADIARARRELEELRSAPARAKESGIPLPGLTADDASRAAEIEAADQRLAQLLNRQQELKRLLDEQSFMPEETAAELDQIEATIARLQGRILEIGVTSEAAGARFREIAAGVATMVAELDLAGAEASALTETITAAARAETPQEIARGFRSAAASLAAATGGAEALSGTAEAAHAALLEAAGEAEALAAEMEEANETGRSFGALSLAGAITPAVTEAARLSRELGIALRTAMAISGALDRRRQEDVFDPRDPRFDSDAFRNERLQREMDAMSYSTTSPFAPEIASRGSIGGGTAPDVGLDAATGAVTGLGDTIRQLEREIALVGKSRAEIAALEAQWSALDRAKQSGIAVTDALARAIATEAETVGALTEELARSQEAQARFEDFAQGIGTAFADAIVEG
ncbi:phage tail tape measure protein, partial [Rhodosalinus sediminis]|uniref:phage tail tape measure protein n=1 Tax=Rhodosalinus sediminis TaxID=1940533 RepID=UPI0023536120